MKFYAACGCSTGKIRRNNEDNFCFQGRTLPQDNNGLSEILQESGEVDDSRYFGVFDGMGGEAFGDEAAYLAASELKRRADERSGPAERVLLETCTAANQKICAAARRHGAGRMGSTAAMLGLDGRQACVVNLGDSKVYLFRQRTLQQLSVDHTDQALMQLHGVTNRKPRLTQHLGIEPSEMVIEPAVCRVALMSGDQFLICSDGLTDMLSVAEIEKILQTVSSPFNQVEILINSALSHGGKDNITVINCLVE